MFETLVFCAGRPAVFVGYYELVDAGPQVRADNFVGAVGRAVVDMGGNSVLW